MTPARPRSSANPPSAAPALIPAPAPVDSPPPVPDPPVAVPDAAAAALPPKGVRTPSRVESHDFSIGSFEGAAEHRGLVPVAGWCVWAAGEVLGVGVDDAIREREIEQRDGMSMDWVTPELPEV
ncbi:uncharacterized protein BKCO1_630002 [Diplodia corticola]|uniref:Uncharacterized protein n=1 Tax=Diplodia corticola TaxID=236234 RepID=A0A1J9RP64_9PEZI|nr:uncharacterized protein BKCO1_630002 [Diplodia corticola]OJD30263.1 hypothetical protein BKCO1_630002 [Diplodia corticola]